MAPLREFTSWDVRYKKNIEIEPKKAYYVICEGSKTEKAYFEK